MVKRRKPDELQERSLLTARSQPIWARAIIDADPDRRRVAKACGISPRMLGRYISGTSKVTQELAKAIARSSGLTVTMVSADGFYLGEDLTSSGLEQGCDE